MSWMQQSLTCVAMLFMVWNGSRILLQKWKCGLQTSCRWAQWDRPMLVIRLWQLLRRAYGQLFSLVVWLACHFDAGCKSRSSFESALQLQMMCTHKDTHWVSLTYIKQFKLLKHDWTNFKIIIFSTNSKQHYTEMSCKWRWSTGKSITSLTNMCLQVTILYVQLVPPWPVDSTRQHAEIGSHIKKITASVFWWIFEYNFEGWEKQHRGTRKNCSFLKNIRTTPVYGQSLLPLLQSYDLVAKAPPKSPPKMQQKSFPVVETIFWGSPRCVLGMPKRAGCLCTILRSCNFLKKMRESMLCIEHAEIWRWTKKSMGGCKTH